MNLIYVILIMRGKREMAASSRHDLGYWSDPDYDESGHCIEADEEEDFPTFFCAACHDKLVAEEGDICDTCPLSDPSDWVYPPPIRP
jgi:hypothetical protein